MRIKLLALAAVAGVSLGGCAYDGFGTGIGVGYGDYGYGGYGSYGYGSPYGYGYGSPYGYGDPYGWYGGYYYPGTGYYVYDQDRNRYPMDARTRDYWEHRHRDGTHRVNENWSGFGHTIRDQVLRSQGSGVTSSSAGQAPIASPRPDWSQRHADFGRRPAEARSDRGATTASEPATSGGEDRPRRHRSD